MFSQNLVILFIQVLLHTQSHSHPGTKHVCLMVRHTVIYFEENCVLIKKFLFFLSNWEMKRVDVTWKCMVVIVAESLFGSFPRS